MAADLRDRGIDIANEAVAADNAGNYEDAINKYIKAVGFLQTAVKYEKNQITINTIRDKCKEYVQRAETLKDGLSGKGKGKAKAQAGGGGKEEETDDDEDEIDPGPLTEEQLAAAEAEMNEALSKLIGMESVKKQMRQLCKQLSLDIRRRAEGHSTMDGIRHMMFTGNPGVGKTTVSRLVARLYKQLGVSSKDHVVEVQKGDLVAGYVNQTSMKTAKKIKEARGGILFVDEAYQLTQALQRGQSDFSGEAIDEMMKVRAHAVTLALPSRGPRHWPGLCRSCFAACSVSRHLPSPAIHSLSSCVVQVMNESGRKSVTFIFAGYKKEMDEFVQYNPGLVSRIKYRFHFEDYSVEDLVKIVQIKIQASGYKMSPDAAGSLHSIIDKGTTVELRSKYNGRLTDNLLQWSSDHMNQRLPLNSKGDELVTLHKIDLSEGVKKFLLARPPQKKDPALLGGEQVEQQLAMWGLAEYSPLFVRAGYRQLIDLIHLTEKDIRVLGVTKDAEIRRAVALVGRLRQEDRKMSLEMDALFIDPDTLDMRTWLEKRSLGDFIKIFEKHKIDFEVLGDVTYDDLREMGLVEVGPRRRVYRAISTWRDDRDAKKADAIRTRMASQEQRKYLYDEHRNMDQVGERLAELKHSLGGV